MDWPECRHVYCKTMLGWNNFCEISVIILICTLYVTIRLWYSSVASKWCSLAHVQLVITYAYVSVLHPDIRLWHDSISFHIILAQANNFHKMAAHNYCVQLVDPESLFLDGGLSLSLKLFGKALSNNLLHFTLLVTGRHNGWGVA